MFDFLHLLAGRSDVDQCSEVRTFKAATECQLHHELAQTAVSFREPQTSDPTSALTAQGSECRWNTRANLWTFRNPISYRASEDGTMVGAKERGCKMGCYDLNMCGDADLLFDGG